jgi:hypothetical protein
VAALVQVVEVGDPAALGEFVLGGAIVAGDAQPGVATRPGQDISDADLTRALTNAGYDVKGITRTQRSIADIRATLKKSGK